MEYIYHLKIETKEVHSIIRTLIQSVTLHLVITMLRKTFHLRLLTFFVAIKSMQNAQALDHTNGLTKYIYKYVGKFDDGNYVFLCQDIHTGECVLGGNILTTLKL